VKSNFAVQQAAAPVALRERAQFLQELAAELGRHSVIGPGTVHRAGADLQHRFTVEARNMAVLDQKRESARGRRGAYPRFGETAPDQNRGLDINWIGKI
jgi:hypothetical protein